MTILPAGERKSFEAWKEASKADRPMFMFWNIIMQLELLQFVFVRSERERLFKLYGEVLVELCKWYFALDRTHYQHWMPIHLRDLANLENMHPELFQEFQKGHFVSQRSERRFSAVAHDQVKLESENHFNDCEI